MADGGPDRRPAIPRGAVGREPRCAGRPGTFVVSDRLLEEFLRACGADGPLQIDVEFGEDPAERRILPQPFVVVGRDSNTDLCVDHPLVSRRHAYLQVIAGRVFCIDLGSRTGTRWEERFGGSGWLDRGQVLRL